LGILNFFKKKTPPQERANLALLHCDIHSHLIPSIDDGSKSMTESIHLIAELHQLGYKKLITTPHIMSDYFKNTPEIISKGLEELRTQLKKENIPVEIEAAAEYYLDYDFERKLKEEKMLTFGDNYLLFEISYLNPPENLFESIFNIQTLGFKPVLAHPERYNYFHRDFSIYESLIEKGALLQLNINSLTGHYSEPTKKIAQQMIEKEMISFLGSDCHHVGHINLMKNVVTEKHLITLVNSGKLLNSSL